MTDPGASRVEREMMVEAQIRPALVNDRRVLTAMRILPREEFAPPGSAAYADAAIDLGAGREMLSPLLTGRLAQLAMQSSPSRVLVVGAATGYLAAILAACGANAVALEEDPRFDFSALRRHAPAVEIVSGPLAAGWTGAAPYDAIVIEGAVPALPDAFAAQLTRTGRLVAIVAVDGAGLGPGVRGLARVVVAEHSGPHLAAVTRFDAYARVLPAFQRAPSFSFQA